MSKIHFPLNRRFLDYHSFPGLTNGSEVASFACAVGSCLFCFGGASTAVAGLVGSEPGRDSSGPLEVVSFGVVVLGRFAAMGGRAPLGIRSMASNGIETLMA